MRSFWVPSYRLAIRFESASGITPATQIRMSGISIGEVSEVRLDDERGGVIVIASIREGYRVPQDARPTISRSLLGDATIDITGGNGSAYAPANAQFDGQMPADPLAAVQKLSLEVETTLAAFNETSREWQNVGRNLNSVLGDNQVQLKQTVAKTAVALDDFRVTMSNANKTLAEAGSLLSDKEYRDGIRATLRSLPELVQETRDTIRTVRSTVENVDRNLAQINNATAPLAENSREMSTRLRNTLVNIETLSAEMVVFAQMLKDDDGSLQRLMSDPELYRNLKSSATSLAVLLQNAQPVLRNMDIFSDKIARHPELIGVSGAIRGSSGIKDSSESESPIRRASGRGVPKNR